MFAWILRYKKTEEHAFKTWIDGDNINNRALTAEKSFKWS